MFRLARTNTTRPWVVDADIEGAFNNIGHAALEQAIGNFPARGLITQWLKAGYVEAEMLHPTEAGVPQGGVISPWSGRQGCGSKEVEVLLPSITHSDG